MIKIRPLARQARHCCFSLRPPLIITIAFIQLLPLWPFRFAVSFRLIPLWPLRFPFCLCLFCFSDLDLPLRFDFFRFSCYCSLRRFGCFHLRRFDFFRFTSDNSAFGRLGFPFSLRFFRFNDFDLPLLFWIYFGLGNHRWQARFASAAFASAVSIFRFTSDNSAFWPLRFQVSSSLLPLSPISICRSLRSFFASAVAARLASAAFISAASICRFASANSPNRLGLPLHFDRLRLGGRSRALLRRFSRSHDDETSFQWSPVPRRCVSRSRCFSRTAVYRSGSPIRGHVGQLRQNSALSVGGLLQGSSDRER